ncbi:UNVERIFIED_CONTAM: hypothetical protein K2H54_045051 [Gekko kuhli]
MKLLTVKVVALLLAMSTGVSGQKDSVSQDASASAKEGNPVQLNCSYAGDRAESALVQAMPRRPASFSGFIDCDDL